MQLANSTSASLNVVDYALLWLPTTVALLLVVLGLFLVQRLLDRGGAAAVSGNLFRNQGIMLGLTAVGILAIILIAPIGDRRGELLSLIGIVLSAAIALSSTTVLSNAMAGLMLRAIGNFRIGDFIQCEQHFGRVTERGLVHTEIQNEHRELTTIPNLFLVTHPQTKTRNSGTIVNATVSLGYDVPRQRIEELLIEAATKTELTDPFVRVLELGDFSVTYRVGGMLTQVKQLLTVRSRLNCHVLDALHGGGVEIVSPSFMNQRVHDAAKLFIPKPLIKPQGEPAVVSPAPEEVAFDKADEAESLEALRTTYTEIVAQVAELEEQLKTKSKDVTDDAEGTDQLTRKFGALQQRRDRLGKIIERREAEVQSD